MKVFVTGGSGFVGRNLLRTLKEQGIPAVALCRSDAAARTVQDQGAIPARGSLENVNEIAKGMEGCDVAVHCAAFVDDWGPYAAYFQGNVTGTENVQAAARQAGVSRLVHVSTEAVLVDGPPIVNADETRPRPKKPIGNYPTTKGMAEERVLAANGSGLATVIVRPRLIWGRDDTTLLPKIRASVESGVFKWMGGGRYLTSSCHVDNVCEGILLAAQKGKPGGIYFLTDGKPVEFRSFVSQLLATQGVEVGDGSVPRGLVYAGATVAESVWRILGIKSAPPVTRTAVLLAGQEVTVNDARARAELGYVGKVTIEEGLAQLRGQPRN